MSLLEGYCAGRKALAEELLRITGEGCQGLQFAADVLWSSSWCDDRGVPHPFFESRKKNRIEVIGAPRETATVERAGDYLRFKTTTNWGLDLTQWPDADVYLKHLSKSMRKRINWLKNSFPRLGVRYEPISTRKQVDRFLKIFRARWPDSQWENEYYEWFVNFYEWLEECGANGSYIMVDADGHDVAAVMGYYNARAYNLHLLCRVEGQLEKYSPGLFLVWYMIHELYERNAADYFFMGPGRFDYKEKYGAKEMPIYRYEKRGLGNLHGILKLYNRARTQHTRRG